MHNDRAIAALELMGSYFGNVTDPNVLTYGEQDILNQFLSKNAVFVRGWYSTALSYVDLYSEGGIDSRGDTLFWNITRLPGYATLGGVSMALSDHLTIQNMSSSHDGGNGSSFDYFEFADYTASFGSSLVKWTQTQIVPPYRQFLDNVDGSTYCNSSHRNGINGTYFGSRINICSVDLTNLTSHLGVFWFLWILVIFRLVVI